MFNSLGCVASVLLGSPVVGSPPFSLWTGVFCSICSGDDGTVTLLCSIIDQMDEDDLEGL
jgi:hypothetical protein